jgi:hypothetical protein
MRIIDLRFDLDRLDEEWIFPNMVAVGVPPWLHLFFACDLTKPSHCDEFRSLLVSEDFAYWGEATRAISEAGGEVRMYEPGSSLYSVAPRSLLTRVLDEWSQFIVDHEERTVHLDFDPTVLEITDDDGVVIGSFLAELARYHEGDRDDQNHYIDTGVARSFVPNAEQYTAIVGSHYGLAITEDDRWVLIDDRRRIGGDITRRQISGPRPRPGSTATISATGPATTPSTELNRTHLTYSAAWPRLGALRCRRNGPGPRWSGGGSVTGFGKSWRFDPFDGLYPINGFVERRNYVNAGAFGLGNQVGLGEVDPIDFVDLDRTQQ